VLLGIPPEGRGLLDAIAAPESNGRYNIIYGGTTISDFRDHPRFAVPIKSGPNAGKTSSAAGRYQFIGSTWDSLAGKYGLTDFGPANQDRAAWYLAQQDYRARTGQDLYTDLQAGKLSQVSQALSPTWTSLSGGIEAQNSGTGATFARNYALGVAAANAGVTADNAPASPDKPQDSPVTDETPKKYIGVGYTKEGAPVYVKDPTPNWTFKQAAEFQLSDNGFLDIKNFETNKGPRPSDEPGKVFRSVCDNKNMIGYGHVLEDGATTVKIDGKDLPISEGITDEQAESLLKEDLKAIESAVKNSVSNLITQEQFDALVDFAWNIGVEKFRNSDVVKLITDKKYDSVPTEMVKWVVACGFVREELVSRRRANALRFAGIIRTEVPAVISGSPTTTGQGWGGATVKFPEYPWLLFTSGPGGIVNNPANPQGFTNTSPTILNKINQMGERLQIVLLINSGYRSDSYNLSVGGVPAPRSESGGLARPRTGHLASPALGVDVSIRNVPGGKDTLKKLTDELRLKWYDYNYVGHLHVEIP
jgi:muramidase (phage lysozyme)/GH24 family phage-related lysozyme (muramidase)